MNTAVETLTSLAEDDDRFSYSQKALEKMQLQALDERFQERRDKIRLLGHRAGQTGISKIASLDDMVPLLFPHTAYKSYPESRLTGGKWDKLGKWLETLSP